MNEAFAVLRMFFIIFRMYVNAMGLRGISRVKKLHHTTIINSIKQAGKLLPRSYSPQKTPQVRELEELQT